MQTINWVMNLGAVKKHKCLIYTVLLLVFIILCLFHKEINSINNTQIALESAISDVKSLFDVVTVPGGLKSPFILEYKTEADENINRITFLNNKKDAYMCLGIDGKIKLNIFAHNNKLGFYTSNTPEIRYTASSKNFTANWNNSLYGKIIKMPDFVPENLNYKKINSFFNSKKLLNASVALGLGKEKININDLKKNISVSKKGTYSRMLPAKKEIVSVIRISIPKKDVINCISQNLSFADDEYKGYAVDFLNKFKNKLELADEDTINIDLSVCNRKLLDVRLIFNSKSYVFSNNKSKLNFTVSDLKSKNNLFQLNIDKPSENCLMAHIKTNKMYVLKANKTYDDNIYLSFGDAESKQLKYKITYSPYSFNSNIKYTEKDIYNLSVYELLCALERITK